MPSSAVSSWAQFAQVDSGVGPFLTLALMFVQLCGLLAFFSGAMKVIYFFTPGHQKAPANLGYPLFQIVLGLFALVPSRVYDLALDTLKSMGWV